MLPPACDGTEERPRCLALSCQLMSRKRQAPPKPHDEGLLLRSYAVTHPPNLGIGPRSYDGWDQLAYASRGVMTVVTAEGTWVVPPNRAVWIPEGVLHSVRMAGR